jgi:hypothetical protein
MFAKHELSGLENEVLFQCWEHHENQTVRLIWLSSTADAKARFGPDDGYVAIAGEYDVRICDLRTGYFEDVKKKNQLPRPSHWRLTDESRDTLEAYLRTMEPDLEVHRKERRWSGKPKLTRKKKSPDDRQLPLFGGDV